MTYQIDDIVVGLVALNGGEIIGKTRLQKSIFLLEECGLNSGVEFDYHWYGPFASDVALAADQCVASGLLQAEERPGFHSAPYTVYRTERDAPPRIGGLSSATVREKLGHLNAHSALDLEVAATIQYLRKNGYGKQAAAETVRRKPAKASPDRVQNAEKLLKGLGL